MSVAELLHYTYADYLQWEGEWELIEGCPISMAPAPMRIHQEIATELIYALRSTLDEDVCPECVLAYETDWKVSEETVLRPDIVLACNDEHEAYLSKAPKLIVEVISPSTARKDETVKFDIYEAEGVQYYLLVYPDDLRAKVYTLKENRYVKVGDFTHELLQMDDLPCAVSVDFGKVFGRFRKKQRR
jgi:Uma2 family endonuclease